MALHIVTFASDETRLIYLKQSEQLFNVNIKYIIKNKWDGYYTKITETQKYINDLPENDIVLFIDAYDVIINSNYIEILHKFLSYECDILLSGELNCYPEFYKNDMDNIMPLVIKNKYINSGGYIGYIKDINKLFLWKPINEIINICEVGSDQSYFIKYFIENYKHVNIKIDINSLVFQCMHLISWKEIDFRHGRVFNNIFNSYPCFIHFNGGTFKTQNKENIMPVFLDKIKLSKINPTEIYTLNEYSQIITNTCYPHPQL